MNISKDPSTQLRFFGYLLLAIGFSFVIHELATRTNIWVPRDIGVVIGYTAMILLALTTLQIGRCFKILEDRLSKIEKRD